MSAVHLYIALAALLFVIPLWLGYSAWAWHKHDPDDAVKLIRATGLYFPLRPRLPRLSRGRNRDNSEDS